MKKEEQEKQKIVTSKETASSADPLEFLAEADLEFALRTVGIFFSGYRGKELEDYELYSYRRLPFITETWRAMVESLPKNFRDFSIRPRALVDESGSVIETTKQELLDAIKSAIESDPLELECLLVAYKINNRIADIQKLRAENDALSIHLREAMARVKAA